jgi:hypothetical protein
MSVHAARQKQQQQQQQMNAYLLSGSRVTSTECTRFAFGGKKKEGRKEERREDVLDTPASLNTNPKRERKNCWHVRFSLGN